ncbi:fibronectin-binding autotransporter adhesin [Verrucomicrobium sp. GAS474]|uniref:PEP-CTERM sorting domain-containing protein n=1 Tax=Verrucomicrobium sp. GAS474 TaxID=1882831 RepID=UPI00087B58E2|nr:PEP-CTERM sorting domain-containing protein [Verrucomicrobium sp. GAS474]SDT94899.1 fibronectin-binding autotransporter adhesin [Verrucomicrobium sp. GAS474]
MIGFSGATASAQSVWNGGGTDGNFSTALNWASGVAPTSAVTTVLQIGGSSQTAINIDTPFSAQSLTFLSGASAFTLSGNTLSLTGTGGVNVTNSSASVQTIAASMSVASGGFAATGANMTVSGNVAISGNNFTLTAGGGKTLTVSGALTGGITAGNFAINAAGGTVVLSGASTIGNTINIWNGNVVAGTSSSTTTGGAFGKGSVSLGLSGQSSSSILVSGAYTIGNNIRVITNTNGAVYTLGGSTADISTYSGAISLGTSTAAGTAGMGVTLTAASGGRVNFTGGIRHETTSTAGNSSDAVTKTGAGIVAISGTNNTYLGITTVSAGTLLVNGTLSGTGAVSVASAAVLGGNGTVSGAVTVASGGILSAGDMDASGTSLTGTLTLGGGLALNTGSTLKFDLGSASDLVAVTGNLILGGTLSLTAGSGFGAGTYELFSYSGTLTDNTLTVGTSPAGYAYTVDTSTAGVVNLQVVAVPEPAPLVLMGAGMAAFLLLRRRPARCAA